MKLESIKEKIFERIGKSKKLEFCIYSAMLAAAFIIFAATGGISCGRTGENHSATRENETEKGIRTDAELEAALEETLSNIDGAGKVKVMLSFVPIDVNVTSALEEKNGYDLTGNESFGLLPLDGKESNPTQNGYSIGGVIVIASGATDLRVRSQLTDAVKTLLGIDASRVGVYTMAP